MAGTLSCCPSRGDIDPHHHHTPPLRPGDRVSITGILRALPMRVNPRQRSLHALFKVGHGRGNEASRKNIIQLELSYAARLPPLAPSLTINPPRPSSLRPTLT